MSQNTVRLDVADGIATLCLDRPPVNAIDLDFVRAAAACLANIDPDGPVRAVILTGAGACFSAGLDLKAVPRYGPAEQREMIETINRTAGHLYALPVPTVAAINGHAIAGGLVLALACDYRICTRAACHLGLTEARAGIPFPAVPMAVVQAELSPPAARRLTLLARNLDPEDALAWGVVDELHLPHQVVPRAHEVARDLATIPGTAYAKIKRQLRAATIARIEHVIVTGADPFINDWLTAETAGASAALLADTRSR